MTVKGTQGTFPAMDMGGLISSVPTDCPLAGRAAALASSRRRSKLATRLKPRTITAIPAAAMATPWITG